MAAEDSEWERVRHMTLDQIVTATKFLGSGTMHLGFTTPEGWPFVVVVAIASPGSEAVVPLTRQYHQVMREACSWTVESHNTEVP